MAESSSNPSSGVQPERAYLLWRSIMRFKEFQEGQYRLNKEISIRTFRNLTDEFLELNQEKFLKAFANLLGNQVASASDKDKFLRIANKIFESFKREIQYTANRREQFSMDILFSIIETVFMEAGANKAESAVMAMENQKSGITKQDLEQILGYLKAFNKMNSRFLACGSMKKAIELSDDIIMGIALENPQIPILALDSMFNLITAQYILSQKYSCKDLLAGWKKEYGFSDEDTLKIAKLLPPQSSLLEFRNHYTKAIQAMQARIKGGDPTGEMDLFLLRTVSNYFTSWINQVANQIVKKEPL